MNIAAQNSASHAASAASKSDDAADRIQNQRALLNIIRNSCETIVKATQVQEAAMGKGGRGKNKNNEKEAEGVKPAAKTKPAEGHRSGGGQEHRGGDGQDT